MAESATIGATRKVRHRGDGSCATRAECERRYRAAFPAGKPHRKQLDRLPMLVDWLARCARSDGETFLRSQPQIARAWTRAGVTWKPTGQPKRDHEAYHQSVKRYLGYLKAMGYVVDWEPVYKPNGEGRGVRITVSADVAQLAIATRVRRRRGHTDFSSAPPRRRASISGTLALPFGETTVVVSPKLRGTTDGGVCARPSIDERDAGTEGPGVGAHESPGVTAAGEGRGRASAPPPLGSVLAAMLEAWQRRTEAPAKCSASWAAVAERAVDRLDRHPPRFGLPAGGARRLAVELVERQAADDWPASLAWFVAGLDALSKYHRHNAHHDAGECGPRCRASVDAAERAAVYTINRGR